MKNTAKMDPLEHLLGVMEQGNTEYITGMEAQGQKELVNDDVMPADAPWEDLISLGFVKGEPVEGDELFVHAELPNGWKKVGSDHDMWSYVVDEKNEQRVAVFYKAAFYDRRAHAHIITPADSASA